MVIDFCALNEKMIGDAYSFPNIIEILDQLGTAKYFGVLDLASGFHQILMHEFIYMYRKQPFPLCTNIIIFNRMSFRLKNMSTTFQRLMDQVLSELQGNDMFVYFNEHTTSSFTRLLWPNIR